MSIISVVMVLIVISTVYYAWFVLSAYRGLRSRGPSAEVKDAAMVSVVVAARNEECTISACLEALAIQDYPAERLECIVVDDGSVDRTAAVVQDHIQQDRRFHLLQLERQTEHRPSRKRGRKPEALAAGIARASGAIILITDADCRPNSLWVKTLSSAIEDDVVYAVGPIIEANDASFLSSLRSLEILGLTGMAGGRIGIGRPINSLGANLAFRKDVYDLTGGFNYTEIKSDEETMMHRIRDNNLGRIVFVSERSAVVRTTSPPTLTGFWNQRKRWGSMHGRFHNRTILAELSLLYMSLLIPTLGLIGLLAAPSMWIWVALFFSVKLLVDWLMLRKCARLFGDPVRLSVLFVGEVLHSFYILTVSTVAQFLSYTWKDRRVLAVDPSDRS